MPSREKKKHFETPDPTHKVQLLLRPAGKVPRSSFARPGNSTRINAFVNTLGRRNQAKRDAR